MKVINSPLPACWQNFLVPKLTPKEDVIPSGFYTYTQLRQRVKTRHSMMRTILEQGIEEGTIEVAKFRTLTKTNRLKTDIYYRPKNYEGTKDKGHSRNR